MVSTVAPHMTLKIWQRLIGAAAGLDVDERKSFKRTCKFDALLAAFMSDAITVATMFKALLLLC